MTQPETTSVEEKLFRPVSSDSKNADNTTDNHVAIIGGGLGGLSAAIHLRVAGFRVTIYEANDRVGGRANLIEDQGFTFDTGPSLLNYPWVFKDLIETTGRSFGDYVTLLPVDPSVKFLWPNGTTFTLSSTMSRLLEECERLEPGSRPDVLAFFKDAEAKFRLTFEKMINRNEDRITRWLGALSPSEIWSTGIWRSLDGELKRFFKNRYIREALGAYGMYLGGTPFELPGIFSILPYGEIAHGLWLPQGGVYGLVRGIERLAMELGIEIHTNCRIEKICTEQSRVVGLETEKYGFQPCSLVVSNVDRPTTDTTILDVEGTSRPPRMTPGVITFYWGIRGKVDGLPHHSIFLSDNYKLAFDELVKQHRIPGDLPFYTSVPSETDPDLAPDGDTSMFVLVPTPVISKMPDVSRGEVITDVRNRVFTRLRDHGVRLSEDQIVVEHTWSPAEWQQRFGLFDGSAFGASHTLMQVGPFRQRNYSDRIEGMYYTGASTTPGTGMPMVILSGKQTAERIVARVHQA